MYKRTRWGFALLALAIGLGVWILRETPLQYGIDLQGGSELVYELDLRHIETGREEVATKVKDIISNRLNVYGLKEISVSVQGEDRLVVQLPGQGGQAVESIKRQVESAGKLEFRLVATPDQQDPQAQQAYRQEEGRYNNELADWIRRKRANPELADPRPIEPQFIVREEVEKDPDDPEGGLKSSGRIHTLVNTPEGIVSGDHLTRVGPTFDSQTMQPGVAFEFNGEGARQFGDMTGPNKDRGLAILLDDDIMQVANIKDRITTNGQLTGNFSQDEVQGVVTVLQGGSLPTKPRLLSEITVGSVIGEDEIETSRRAMVWALVVVMGIMTTYYLAAGLVANFALSLNVFFLFTYVACFRQTLTLPGVAGILLTVGMAVDANILIFERVREEKKKGKSLLQALTTGYQRAFWVIFDANLTTLITGFVLFNFGTGPVKGFAVTLISGIAISFVTAIFVTRLVISLLRNFGWVSELKMFQAFDTPNIGFVARQKPVFACSMVAIILTWGLVGYRGEDNYGIDFTSGTRINMQLRRPVAIVQMRQHIDALQQQNPQLFRDYTLQTLRAEDGMARGFALRTRTDPTGGNQAEAQEKPDGAGAPPAEGAVPAGSPAEAVVDPLAPVAITQAPGADRAQQVRRVLEVMLKENDLLLPELLPLKQWRAETGAADSGKHYLVLEANLINVRSTTPVDLKQTINDEFAENPVLQPRSTVGDGIFEGVSVQEVELVQKSGEDGVTRYRFVTNAYQAPLQALSTNSAPTQSQVEEAFGQFFHDYGPGASAHDREPLFDVSDPFPEVSTVGPRVASSLQTDAVVALFISMLGIIFYVSLRFEFIFGVAAIVALIHDILIGIGVVAFVDHFFGETFPVKINLAELAALLTIIGYSINDTIVVFDRIRENMQLLVKKRVPFTEIVNRSINQTLTRTLWTSVTTMIVTIVLLLFAAESVRGFAFIFAIGVITGTYSSVFVASPVLIWLQKRSVERREQAAVSATA